MLPIFLSILGILPNLSIMKGLLDFFKKNKELEILINRGTTRAKRYSSFFLTIIYILFLWVTSYYGLTKESLIIFGKALSVSALSQYLGILLFILSILPILIGNAIHYKLLLEGQLAEVLVLSVLGIIFRKHEYVTYIIFCLIDIFIIFMLKLYIYQNKYNEQTLNKAAYYDTLTKCINRRGLLKHLEKLSLIDTPFYLVFLDLDNFKAVNDTLGHNAGDELLKFVAEKWSNIKSFDDCTLARLGGDEFAMVIETDNKNVADRVVKEMFKSIKTGNELASYVTTSAGLASFPDDSRDIQKLLSYADTAMYKAKTSGKNRFMFFNAKMYKEIVDKYNIEKQIKTALDDDKFYLLYQPQYIYSKDNPLGYEVLLRMVTKSEDLAPDKFIGIAEQSGIICDVDTWVMQHALTESKVLLDINPNLVIAINLSSKHLCDINLIEDVMNVLEKTGFPAKNLEFEIMESSYIKHMDEAIENITKLKLLGCRVALDNFGTGYASLSYLTKMHVDIVKIDRSFIKDIFTDEEKAKFVNIIVQLAHLLKCKVIAEGVENKDQAELLSKLDVDMMQGFYWGKPIKINETIDLLKK